jgi:Ca2+-binding EF-hand superfamily protein
VRDTFLKLLRPGVDYRETFLEYVEKNVFARRVAQWKERKNYDTADEEDLPQLDEELEGLRKEWLSHTALSKEDMRKLLLQMGISLKETEMRALIDAFDANGDGVITIGEFLDFTGPKRDKRSGNSVVMAQRCCWLTTCKVTGMPGAYSVSAPTKRALRAEESKYSEDGRTRNSASSLRKSGGSYGEDAEGDEAGAKQAHASTLGKVEMVVRKLANGENRVCIELRERKKREELLRKMGLLDDSKGSSGEKKRGKGKRSESKHGDEDNYEDDFADIEEEYGEDFEEGDKGAEKGKTGTLGGTAGSAANCDYSGWRAEDRKEGLKFLMEMTRDARQEETLKSLLANGVPPAPPKLWMKNEHFLEIKSLNRRSTASGSLRGSRKEEGKGGEDVDEDAEEELGPESTEITVFWGPHKGDLVSFYSLEYGGVVGSNKTSDIKYQEIFRDPPDADPSSSFDFSYVMRNLTPGASYRFRVRAFNGFGAGDYTYKTFTTITAAPSQPRLIKVASDSAWLKWTFSQGFFRRLDELRRIFTLADSDKSGMVSREELTALLDERASASPELKDFLNKVATSLGLVVTQGYDALFDMIEGDDDGGLTWEEFENFFMAAVRFLFLDGCRFCPTLCQVLTIFPLLSAALTVATGLGKHPKHRRRHRGVRHAAVHHEGGRGAGGGGHHHHAGVHRLRDRALRGTSNAFVSLKFLHGQTYLRRVGDCSYSFALSLYFLYDSLRSTTSTRRSCVRPWATGRSTAWSPASRIASACTRSTPTVSPARTPPRCWCTRWWRRPSPPWRRRSWSWRARSRWRGRRGAASLARVTKPSRTACWASGPARWATTRAVFP